jgi:TPR repeat protein
MIKAAMGGHLEAMYTLAVIQFNGSGGTRTDRRLEMEAGLCTRAANMGHTGALRELSFYLRDGYGVLHATQDGRRLII